MKVFFSNIKTLLKPALSVLLSAVVVYSGLMLCCQVGLTSLHSQWGKAKTCCHLSSGSQWKAKAEKNCTCCGFVKNVLDSTKEAFSIARLISLPDLNYVFAVNPLPRFAIHKIVLALASQGPPHSLSNTPLYIKHSNLRL